MSHKLTVRVTSETPWPDQPGTTDDAIAARIARLKESKIAHRCNAYPCWKEITYTDPLSGDHITLTYTELETP